MYIANRIANKIEHITDRICMCRSGSAADTQKIGRIIRTQLDSFQYAVYSIHNHRTMYGLKPTVKNAAKLAQSIIYKYKDHLQAGIIVAGYDDVEGPSVYQVTLGGSLFKQTVCLGGSGSVYIYGYVESKYNPEMTVEEGLEFVRRCILFLPLPCIRNLH